MRNRARRGVGDTPKGRLVRVLSPLSGPAHFQLGPLGFRYASLHVTLRNMTKLTEKCGLCNSWTWCGRGCSSSPARKSGRKAPLPKDPPAFKPFKDGKGYSKKTTLYVHNCGWCGEEFRGSMDRSYCSDSCRVTAWRANKKGSPTGNILIGWSKLRFTVLERDGFKCRYCGRGAKQNVVLEVDHIVPRSAGGTAKLDNLATACRECNSGKSSRQLKSVPE